MNEELSPVAVKRPGTCRSESNAGSSYRIMAIAESRGPSAEIGLASIDLKTSECILSQFADFQTYAHLTYKLSLIEPSLILLPLTSAEPNQSKLFNMLTETDVDIVNVARKCFNELEGLACIKKFALEDEAAHLAIELSNKYYCLSALSALFKYIESVEDIVFIIKTINFKYQGCEGIMMMDCETARNLEIINNLSNRTCSHSLFGILNHTQTAMGGRFLRGNLLQPPTDIATIAMRLDCVEELRKDEDTFLNCMHALKLIPDVDHLITAFIQKPRKTTLKMSRTSINHVVHLRSLLIRISAIAAAIESCQNELLHVIHEVLSDPGIKQMQKEIDAIISDDIHSAKGTLGYRNQRCFAVKSGFNSLLDVARKTYLEAVADIENLTRQYSENYGISLKIEHAESIGFYLSTQQSNLKDYILDSSVFLNVTKKQKKFTFTSLDLMKYNDRIKESITEIYIMSERIIGDLVTDIHQNIIILYKISESIAILDMLVSFAKYASLAVTTVRPEFTETFALRDARHPIKEKAALSPFVPNDVFANDTSNFQIITGPNMSGKSTYLREIALLTLMAHIGSFVPASYASFRITDKLFTRICNDDLFEANASTFTMEMRDCAYILQNLTPNSLVILDELGRGTSTFDGVGITFAICEELLNSKAITFFATHFRHLAQSLEVYPNVLNLHLNVNILDLDKLLAENQLPNITYSFTLSDGVSNAESYATTLAAMANMPNDVILSARQITERVFKLGSEVHEQTEKLIHTTYRVQYQRTSKIIQANRLANLSNQDLVAFYKSL